MNNIIHCSILYDSVLGLLSISINTTLTFRTFTNTKLVINTVSYLRDPHLVITLPVDDPTPNGVKPSAGTTLVHNIISRQNFPMASRDSFALEPQDFTDCLIHNHIDGRSVSRKSALTSTRPVGGIALKTALKLCNIPKLVISSRVILPR